MANDGLRPIYNDIGLDVITKDISNTEIDNCWTIILEIPFIA